MQELTKFTFYTPFAVLQQNSHENQRGGKFEI